MARKNAPISTTSDHTVPADNASEDTRNFLPHLCAATELVPAQQPQWLVRNRVPRAATSLLVGDEGIGKSLYWAWLASYITTGKPLSEYGIPERDPAHVLLVITEDNWSSTVLPRLEVSGVDLERVHVLCTDRDGSGAPVFPRDMPFIVGADPAPALVVVDAWLDTVEAKLSVRDSQQARRALHPWGEAATRTGSAVLLLTHTNRIASPDARNLYGGSGELRKKARMALLASADEDGALLVGPEKANGTRTLPATRFRFESVAHFAPNDEDDGTVPRLVYDGHLDRTMRELIADRYAGDDAETVETIDAWLRNYMESHGGSCESRAVFAAGATTPGKYSRDQLNRAKKRIGIDSKKAGDKWLWALKN
jgi:hypothetical protein